jgi:hypothetical protein
MFITERIWAGIFGSMLWHWSSMNATPAAGFSASALTTSCMMRKCMSITALRLAAESLSAPSAGPFHGHGQKWAVFGTNWP